MSVLQASDKTTVDRGKVGWK